MKSSYRPQPPASRSFEEEVDDDRIVQLRRQFSFDLKMYQRAGLGLGDVMLDVHRCYGHRRWLVWLDQYLASLRRRKREQEGT